MSIRGALTTESVQPVMSCLRPSPGAVPLTTPAPP
jgi:hypothetical protein